MLLLLFSKQDSCGKDKNSIRLIDCLIVCLCEYQSELSHRKSNHSHLSQMMKIAPRWGSRWRCIKRCVATPNFTLAWHLRVSAGWLLPVSLTFRTMFPSWALYPWSSRPISVPPSQTYYERGLRNSSQPLFLPSLFHKIFSMHLCSRCWRRRDQSSAELTRTQWVRLPKSITS